MKTMRSKLTPFGIPVLALGLGLLGAGCPGGGDPETLCDQGLGELIVSNLTGECLELTMTPKGTSSASVHEICGQSETDLVDVDTYEIRVTGKTSGLRYFLGDVNVECEAPAALNIKNGVPDNYPFVAQVLLSGPGEGSVTSGDGKIDCGTLCNAAVGENASLTLVATPASGSVFAGWSGDCSGSSTTCQLTVDGIKTVEARFTAYHGLNVTLAGDGAGQVRSVNLAGINCGADCSEQYETGTEVRLRALAAAGSVFTGWEGACTGTGDCLVTVANAASVTARFEPRSTDFTGLRLLNATGQAVTFEVRADPMDYRGEFETNANVPSRTLAPATEVRVSCGTNPEYNPDFPTPSLSIPVHITRAEIRISSDNGLQAVSLDTVGSPIYSITNLTSSKHYCHFERRPTGLASTSHEVFGGNFTYNFPSMAPQAYTVTARSGSTVLGVLEDVPAGVNRSVELVRDLDGDGFTLRQF